MSDSIAGKLSNLVKNSIPGAARLRVAKVWKGTYEEKIGSLKKADHEGYSLVSYDSDEGFDYDTYKAIQEEGNKAKLHGQWVTRQHITTLAEYAVSKGVTVERGVCHGTRQGNEQMWFREALGEDADVIGTEISSTATDFPHTVQWDFHEQNLEWVGQMGIVYSNSWDHAYDPEKAFSAWIDMLKPGGLLFLDHSRYHLPDRANELDPFGADWNALVALVEKVGAGKGEIVGKIDNKLSDDTTNAPVDLPVVTLVFQRSL